jgi:hypothetical protein
MKVHETKRFIGRTIQGFDFLGYTIHLYRTPIRGQHPI